MKITAEKLMIWAKRAVLALALAATAGVMLPSCEKEPKEEPYREPYEKILWFDDRDVDSIQMNIVEHFAKDTACKYIYLSLRDVNAFMNYNVENWRISLEKRVNLSNKISGNGDFNIYGAVNPTDSIWFVNNGWTVNQRRYNYR